MKRFPARLLLHNRAWVANRLELRSHYFGTLSKGQAPSALWIGCCDSRVPAEEITGARPGELFVHRNIANLVHLNDPGLDSVLYYSLKVLKVPYIIVCGHTQCGGVLSAIHGPQEESLSTWLAPLRESLPDPFTKYRSMEEIPSSVSEKVATDNVTRGLERLLSHACVKEAMEEGTLWGLHGWMYHLSTGIIDPVCHHSTDQQTTGVLPSSASAGTIL